MGRAGLCVRQRLVQFAENLSGEQSLEWPSGWNVCPTYAQHLLDALRIDIAQVALLLSQRDARQILHLDILGEEGALVRAQQPVALVALPLGNVRVPLVDVFAQVAGAGRIGQPVAAHVLLPLALLALLGLDGLDGRMHLIEESHAVLELAPSQPILSHLLLLAMLGLFHFQFLALTRLLQLL